ncbi:MAG: tetratricopeptide repeat protein, partial [Gammaproteobacteria bacterium]|nr:tetratricopeptide repeat protein [Gammaproteobacteria bacterium]
AMIGSAHTLQGNYDIGLHYTQRAVGLEPGDHSSQQWLAISLLRSGRHREAIAPLQEALRLDPHDSQMPYLCILGMLHFAAGENEKAIAAFERDQLGGFRRGPYVYAMQAAAYAELGDESAARALIPELNADILALDFPLEHWLAGMLPDPQKHELTYTTLYQLGLLRPEERAAALEDERLPGN